MTVDIGALCDDLAAEHEALDALVGDLSDDDWARPSPADGWDVRDCVGHICYFDETARLALTDPDRFSAHAQATADDPTRRADEELSRAHAPASLLARWRASRAALLEALRSADTTARVPWYGPPMSVASFVTARLMETWAHGQDVVDAIDAEPVVSERLRHVCHIGVAARPYAFMVNGLEDPPAPIHVVAEAPGGRRWEWGPAGAENRVTGTALDLALVVTRRRVPEDTALVVDGPVAAQWIGIAQSFAGAPGPRRPRGLRAFD